MAMVARSVQTMSSMREILRNIEIRMNEENKDKQRITKIGHQKGAGMGMNSTNDAQTC